MGHMIKSCSNYEVHNTRINFVNCMLTRSHLTRANSDYVQTKPYTVTLGTHVTGNETMLIAQIFDCKHALIV